MSESFGDVLVSDLSPLFRQFMCDRLVGSWKRFIRSLPLTRISEEKITEISDSNEKVAEKSYQAFYAWSKANPEARWSHVRDSLNSINENLLIAQCEEKLLSVTLNDKGTIGSKTAIEIASGELRDGYRRRFKTTQCIVFNNTENKVVNMEDIFVDMKISASDEEGENWKRFVDREYYMCQRKNDEKNQEMKDIFKDSERVILSGIAGIGKTTLLIHSLMEWVKQNHWHDFDFVFHIECRKINYLQRDCNNMEDLLKKLFPEVMTKISFSTLRENSKRVLFVVDGIDEFSCLADVLKIPKGGENIAPIAKALYDVINIDAKHDILVAGRPESALMIKKLFLKSKPLCLDVVGLNDENINRYIENRVGGNEQLRSQINDVINQSPSTKLMSTVPIYLEIICSILEANKDVKFNTLTELYVWVLYYFIRNHFNDSKKGETRFIDMPMPVLFHETEVMETLNSVCQMAYTMLKEGRVIFNSVSFGAVPGRSWEHCGLITKVWLTEMKEVFQFRHLSIMEFCSAVHIFKNLSGQINTLLHEPRLRGCIPIVCGLEAAVLNDTNTPLAVKTFVVSLQLPSIVTKGWMHHLLKGNKATDIHEMDDTFLTSFHESRSSITDQFKGDFTRNYWYYIDDRDVIKHNRCFYFATKLMESGCLNLERIFVNCVREMSRDMQDLMMRMFCLAKEIRIARLPLNFDSKLFSHTYAQHKSKPPLVWLSYYHLSIETFRTCLPIINVVERLVIVLWKEHVVEEDCVEIIDVITSCESLNRILINDFDKQNKQHEHLFNVMKSKLEGKGKMVMLLF